MPLFDILLIFFLDIQYINTFLHPWTFDEAPLHSFITKQLRQTPPWSAESGKLLVFLLEQNKGNAPNNSLRIA